uniref:RIC3 domain-containing protein n=1 Tax=Rhabditophanes sp. KR3021 TaxID=114890 RepID=A0AC35U4I2_9BILA
MGHLDVLPLIARGIDIYMPLAIVILCVGTYLRLGSKFLHSIGIDQFVDEDEITLDFVENGKRLANLERSRTTHEKNKKVRVGFSKREVKDIEESESLISDIHGLKKNASEETLLIELDDIIAQTARTEHPSSLHLFDDL